MWNAKALRRVVSRERKGGAGNEDEESSSVSCDFQLNVSENQGEPEAENGRGELGFVGFQHERQGEVTSLQEQWKRLHL
jgi:hypothetical protein